jgi:cystathionine beta-lyase/cystathionine gamma-synthase
MEREGLAARLNSSVKQVLYPQLDTSATELLHRQRRRRPGAMLAVDLGSEERAKAVLGGFRLATHAVSVGGFEALVEHPTSLTHRIVENDGRAVGGVTDGLIRISVGLEHVDDLAADLAESIDRAS